MPDHLRGEGGHLLGNWLSFLWCNPKVTRFSHVKQRGNHGVTVQPVVSGAKTQAQYFQRE